MNPRPQDGLSSLSGTGTWSASVARHQRLQLWSLRLLARREEQLLGLRFAIDPDSEAALRPALAIVLCRLVSVFDASLPSLRLETSGYDVVGVIMAELLADPGFDLLYGRLGSVFIPREDGDAARHAIGQLGRRVNDSTVAVLFPEGRLFRPEVSVRLHERFSGEGPDSSDAACRSSSRAPAASRWSRITARRFTDRRCCRRRPLRAR